MIFFSMSFQKFRGTSHTSLYKRPLTSIVCDTNEMLFYLFLHAGKEKFQALDSQPIRELLAQLEWMSVAEPALLRVLHSQVRKMTQATCGDEYTEKYLDRVEEWACVELLPWLDDLFHTSPNGVPTLKWREILSQHVLHVRVQGDQLCCTRLWLMVHIMW